LAEKNFVDDWWNHHNDKTLYVLSWSEKEYKVTYKNDDGKKFSVIIKPKKYPIGFHTKY
jgi:hypothetical protein